MGIHDIETMNELTLEAKKINPDITIYGEPWDMSAQLKSFETATQRNASKFNGFGQFNDQLRDALIKGGLNSVTSLGWIDNKVSKTSDLDLDSIVKGLKGITAKSGAFEIKDPDDAKKMNLLANSMVFTSQGTSFMLAGEEFLRTKGGDSNSYESSYKVNELDYKLKVKNFDLFESYKKLIKFKQEVDGLHLNKDNNEKLNINVSENNNLIDFEIKDTKANRVYKIIHANGYKIDELETINLEGYKLYLDTINNEKVLTQSTKIEPFETLIAYK